MPMIWPSPLPCQDCDGEGRVYRSHWGGNDPNGWMVDCEICEGTGDRGCDGFIRETKLRCQEMATMTVENGSEGYCAECGARWLKAAGEDS
jgi:hypothetical protein